MQYCTPMQNLRQHSETMKLSRAIHTHTHKNLLLVIYQYMPLISALRSRRQGDQCEFKVRVVCIESSRPPRSTKDDPVSRK